MEFGDELLLLTPKGTEELRSRAHKLDFTARNILFLIERGCTTADAILQRTIFPRDAVIDRLRRLLGNKFVAIATSDAAKPSVNRPSAVAAVVAAATSVSPELRLHDGASVSQARFALSDFCLNQFGTRGQSLVDVVDQCGDLIALQQALGRIRAEVQTRVPQSLATLLVCVREINETGDEPATAPTSRTNGFAYSSRLHLEPDISVAQARFSLSEFCLDNFGVKGQAFVAQINRCATTADLEKLLERIRTEVTEQFSDRLPALSDCVTEINETAR